LPQYRPIAEADRFGEALELTFKHALSISLNNLQDAPELGPLVVTMSLRKYAAEIIIREINRGRPTQTTLRYVKDADLDMIGFYGRATGDRETRVIFGTVTLGVVARTIGDFSPKQVRELVKVLALRDGGR
jgi:hypothetical protein